MSELKKVLLGVFALGLLFIVFDYFIGGLSEKMYYNSKYGVYHRQIYSLRESKEEILVLGSSRAAHHYVPQLFEDSLGMSCYNAGSDGMCIYYHYALLASRIYRGCPPKLVICDVMGTDAEVSTGATFSLDAALDRLAPHYDETPEIEELFAINGWKEKFKLLSKTYRYNSKLVQTIKCNFIPWPEDKGYEALYGAMDENSENDIPEINSTIEDKKLIYLHKLIKICRDNNVHLILCSSPYYNQPITQGIRLIKKHAEKEKIPFFDFSDYEDLQKREFYRDVSHLNDKGAHLYTSAVLNAIKSNILHQ